MKGNMMFTKKKNKYLKNFNIIKNKCYNIIFYNSSALEGIVFHPDDWCGYKGICPLIEKDINEEAREVVGIYKPNLIVDTCIYLCKFFRKFDIPKITNRKTHREFVGKKTDSINTLI